MDIGEKDRALESTHSQTALRSGPRLPRSVGEFLSLGKAFEGIRPSHSGRTGLPCPVAPAILAVNLERHVSRVLGEARGHEVLEYHVRHSCLQASMTVACNLKVHRGDLPETVPEPNGSLCTALPRTRQRCGGCYCAARRNRTSSRPYSSRKGSNKYTARGQRFPTNWQLWTRAVHNFADKSSLQGCPRCSTVNHRDAQVSSMISFRIVLDSQSSTCSTVERRHVQGLDTNPIRIVFNC